MVSTSSERRALGERLKRQRERRGVSLAAISQKTKISAALFAGLELGDCSRWPVGLYSRAYVRSYAEAIGLNAEETLEDFLAAFGGVQGIDGAFPQGSRGAGPLRLGMVEEPDLTLERVARRIALATTDLLAASGLGWAAYTLIDGSLPLTIGSVLLYYTAGRLVSDEPLPWWLARRAWTTTSRPAPVAEPAEAAAVGSAASTTA